MAKLTFKKRLGRLLSPLMRMLFRLLQPFGLHLVRNHFYEPIPDTRTLKSSYWENRSEMVGIAMNQEKQLDFARAVVPKFLDECRFPVRPTAIAHEFHLGNEFFEAMDAEILHCFIRHLKPSTIIEIGSGYSTMISARAALMNKEKDGVDTEVICIEPNPREQIRKGYPGLTKLYSQRVEEMDMGIFQSLRENDILFIDSSHVVKLGNDVLFEYLEVLPRLNPGVLIHVHDIFLPLPYPKQWVLDECKFWTEQYLLQAFLAFNQDFEVAWASSHMSICFKEEMERAFPSWQGSYTRLPESLKATLTRDRKNVWPVSFWMQRVG